MEKMNRRDFIKKSGVIAGGIAMSLGGLEIVKLSDDVSRKMSHKEVAIAFKDGLVNESGPFVEPTVDSLEMLGMMVGGGIFNLGAGIILAEAINIKPTVALKEADQNQVYERVDLPGGMVDENFVGPFRK